MGVGGAIIEEEEKGIWREMCFWEEDLDCLLGREREIRESEEEEEMVALSMYKGNLHKVIPDVPRQWLMPTRQISLNHFKSLLRRRSRALSRQFIPDPNPKSPHHGNNDPNNNQEMDHNNQITNATTAADPTQFLEQEDAGSAGAELDHCFGKMESAVAQLDVLLLPDSAAAPPTLEEVAAHDDDTVLDKNALEKQEDELAKQQQDKNINNNDEEEEEEETINKEDEDSDKDKRKKEVEEKLKILKEKKHTLVQVLKQIQNAEEELKRRSSAQGMAVLPSVLLQVDIPNDTGSMTRLNTPRMGSDGTLGGEMEGGEHDGMSNHNPDTRHLLRMSSTSPSPSSDSQQKKPAYNVVPHPARTTLGVSSPSRFAPTGQPGQTSNLPTVSVSGTNYVASSPSPAASGGTSVFRESRVPSPWN